MVDDQTVKNNETGKYKYNKGKQNISNPNI